MTEKRIILWQHCPSRYVMPILHPISLSNNGINPEMADSGFFSEIFEPDEIEDMFSENREDFWMIQTNFVITPEDAEMIDSFPGIEYFRIVSSYRFIVACAILFDFAELRKNFEKQLCGDEIQMTDISGVISKPGRFKKWAILEGKKGELLDYICSSIEEDERFEQELKNMKARANNENARIKSNI